MSRSTATIAPERARRPRLGGPGLYAWTALILGCLGLGVPFAWEHYLRFGLPQLAASDVSTIVLDRNGQLLRAFTTREGRWRFPSAPELVDRRFLDLLIACEDKRFFAHGGVDAVALVRAGAQTLVHGRIVSGASTISMQVARLLEPRRVRALGAKVKQMVRASALEVQIGKTGILSLYLQLAPYGGNLQGVRAASLTYFGHEPRRLSLAEAALLVALPQNPERRRPDRFAAAARSARDRILDRAVEHGLASAEEAAAAKAEPVPLGRKAFPVLAPHATAAARAAEPSARVLRMTLDAALQGSLETLVRTNAGRFGPAVSGALLVIDNASGEVRAHVGSADYRSVSRAGALDMTQAFRSPGSALKPFIYALAFENGIASPETTLEDRPTHYGAYAPENFDQTYQGSVSARHALQLSLNLPAVALLDQVGPARFLARLHEAGVNVVVPSDAAPGLAIGLGGLGIRLVDLGRLYAGLARGGDLPVLRESLDVAIAESYARPVADPVASWSVADILRGAPPPPNALGGRIAFKTGTSYGYRDAVAVGFSRRYTVAAWLGRPDNAAVPGLVGRQAAAPVLFDTFARLGGPIEAVPAPPGASLIVARGLPAPLRHLRDRDGTGTPHVKIAYPPDGATVDLGLDRDLAALSLKVEGGAPPFSWFVNGVPAGTASLRRQARWVPDGAGFARVSVSDADGTSDSVAVRLR